MTDARALAERLRYLADELLRRGEITTNEADEMRAAADYLDRLAAPEGVGLTRYRPVTHRDFVTGFSIDKMEESPAGEWVRHKDAAAALAAKDAEIARIKEALADLMSWFPEKPSPAEWRLDEKATDAIEHARALSTLPAPAASEGEG